MIEYLSGTLIEKSPTKGIILCGGVGYAVLISLATYERLGAIGAPAELHTYLAVREDAMTLYGFADPAERDMFLLLTTVNGVGPKIAIGVLSSVGIDTLRENISRGNSAALTSLPGIGKKTAERITLELREKIGAVGGLPTGDIGSKADIRAEALAALMALGYGRAIAERAIRNALKGGPETEANVETLIKQALKAATE